MSADENQIKKKFTVCEADDFRGLLYNPTLENEAVMLFTLLIPHLKYSFAIEEYSGTFPDCFALRNRERIGIEFEFLTSRFNHESDPKLSKCDLIICWKNNNRDTIKRDGKEFLKFNGHEIEVMALNKIVTGLEKKGLKFIKFGEPPEPGKTKEDFFNQLEKNRPDKVNLIKELCDRMDQSKDFEVKYGGGKKRITAKIFVRNWDIWSILISGDGSVEIDYQANKSQPHWYELPDETKAELYKIYKNPKQKPWHTIPLETRTDLDNIYKALGILSEHSKRLEPVWHRKD